MCIKFLEDKKYVLLDLEKYLFENSLKLFFNQNLFTTLNFVFLHFSFSVFYSTGFVTTDLVIHLIKLFKIKKFFMCVFFLEFITVSFLAFIKKKKFDKLSQKMLFHFEFEKIFSNFLLFNIHFVSLSATFRSVFFFHKIFKKSILVVRKRSVVFNSSNVGLLKKNANFCLSLNCCFEPVNFLWFNVFSKKFIKFAKKPVIRWQFDFGFNFYLNLNFRNLLFFTF